MLARRSEKGGKSEREARRASSGPIRPSVVGGSELCASAALVLLLPEDIQRQKAPRCDALGSNRRRRRVRSRSAHRKEGGRKLPVDSTLALSRMKSAWQCGAPFSTTLATPFALSGEKWSTRSVLAGAISNSRRESTRDAEAPAWLFLRGAMTANDDKGKKKSDGEKKSPRPSVAICHAYRSPSWGAELGKLSRQRSLLRDIHADGNKRAEVERFPTPKWGIL